MLARRRGLGLSCAMLDPADLGLPPGALVLVDGGPDHLLRRGRAREPARLRPRRLPRGRARPAALADGFSHRVDRTPRRSPGLRRERARRRVPHSLVRLSELSRRARRGLHSRGGRAPSLSRAEASRPRRRPAPRHGPRPGGRRRPHQTTRPGARPPRASECSSSTSSLSRAEKLAPTGIANRGTIRFPPVSPCPHRPLVVD